MTLGKNIYDYRKQKGLSQEELSELINVTRQTISNWEIDSTAPNPEQLKALSKVLNVSIDVLLDNELFKNKTNKIKLNSSIYYNSTSLNPDILDNIILNKENMLIIDNNILIKEKYDYLIKNGYNVKVLNLDNPNRSNAYNLFYMPYKLYKEGYSNKAFNMIDTIFNDLIKNTSNKDNDPFWIDMSVNLAKGITYYLFDNASLNEINLNSIYSLGNDEKFYNIINDLPLNSASNLILSNFKTYSKDTRDTIITTFSNIFLNIITRENYSEILSNDDINIDTFKNNKVAFFIEYTGSNKYEQALINIILNQIYYNLDNKLNIIINNIYKIGYISDLINQLIYVDNNKKFIVNIVSSNTLNNLYNMDIDTSNFIVLDNHLTSDDTGFDKYPISKFSKNKIYKIKA